jgi:hypothetical protein
MRALLDFVLKLSPHRSQIKIIITYLKKNTEILSAFSAISAVLIIYIKSKIFVKGKILYIVAKTKDNHYLWE